MKRSSSRLAAARTALLLGITAVMAAGFLAGCASAHNSVTTSAPSRQTVLAVMDRNASTAGVRVVVVNCLNKEQVRPANFVLTCADANDYLSVLRWVNWGSEAFGTGTEWINTCTPTCVQGKFVSYPALVVLWRPEPLPGHPGVLYLTRITRIYTGKRPPLYNCQGTRTCYPVTSTMDLWSQA